MKYYKEINDTYYLPIVVNKNTDHSLDNQIMPKNFFDKYNDLFNLINFLSGKIENILNSEINLNKKLLNHKLFIINHMNELYNNITIENLEKFIFVWGEIVDWLYDSGQLKKTYKEYINIMKTFNDALLEIYYKRRKIVDWSLPNVWFITSNGFLYNARATHHAAGEVKDYVDEFNSKFLEEKLSFESHKTGIKKVDVFPDNTNSGLLHNQGYVSFITLDIMLHYIDYIRFNYKIFDPKYITIVQGMLEVRHDYYKFLERLYRNTNNPIEELKKILELTANNYDDILIRCCGCSKVTSSPAKTIVTSRLDYEIEFKEYIENGWNISFFPPIVINEFKGIVEEYNDSKIRKFRR